MSGLLPYKIKYAAGDAKCKKCHSKIRIDCITIAIMTQSDGDDCYNEEWFHQKCFFETRRPSTEAGFDGFALMRYDDQLAIRVELGIVNRRSLHNAETNAPDFAIEYAKASRDVCTECKQKIAKGSIRIMKVVHDVNQNAVSDGLAVWIHVECFARTRSKHDWLESADALPGFKRLNDEDKEIVKRQIPIIKRKMNKSTDNPSSVNAKQLDKLIENQNEAYFKVFDALTEMSPEERVTILNDNKQFVPKSVDEIRHHLTDIIVFGALGPCKMCRNSNFVFRNTKYVCAHETPWAKCGYTIDVPPRVKRRVATAMLKKYPFLKPTESVQTRALHRFQWTDENGNDLVFGVYKKPKLFNMTFVIVGNLSTPNHEIEDTIWKMGGKVVDKIDKNLTAILSKPDEVQTMGASMRKAKRCKIQVISEDFLTAIETTDPFLYIISQSLCDWGGDPYERCEQNEVKARRETAFYTKSLPEVLQYKMKDGSAVDPECGLADNAHVYCGNALERQNVKYSAVLGLVDIENNKNSYYRIQLLESDEIKLYWVFEAWGRISTTIGSKCLKNYGTLEEALEKFNSTYQEKTGNKFGARIFKKVANKFYHLNVEFCAKKKLPDTFVETKLSKPVYELMQMLFDLKRIDDTMFGFDLDLKQMPLGKISSAQIRSAMQVLNRISYLIQHNGTTGQLQEQSNKFYTLVPHAFSVKLPAIIDSIETVNVKNEMLETLLHMELIYGFLDEEHGEKINPLDAYYYKLKNAIVAVDKNSSEYKMLVGIVQSTHGQTHKTYKLEVVEIFKLNREGEDERFEASEQLDRHRLLWHGSRLMNFVSILTNGLKIAPPEAPPTGYMFGKGIYFADIVSKSANYCYTDPVNNTGLMLLCEVALGKSRMLTASCNITDIPNPNEQSVKAFGAYFPTSHSSTVDGVKFKIGPVQSQRQIPTTLYYNEYVVYDPAQVKFKYLFKVKFNFIPGH